MVSSVAQSLQQGQKAEMGSSGSLGSPAATESIELQPRTKQNEKEQKIKWTYQTYWIHLTKQIVGSKL